MSRHTPRDQGARSARWASGEAIKLFPQPLGNRGIAYVARQTGDQSYAQNSSGVVSQQGRIVFTSGAKGASGAFDSPQWSRDGRRMVFHRADDPKPIGVQNWLSTDSRFGLVRVGLSFPSVLTRWCTRHGQ